MSRSHIARKVGDRIDESWATESRVCGVNSADGRLVGITVIESGLEDVWMTEDGSKKDLIAEGRCKND